LGRDVRMICRYSYDLRSMAYRRGCNFLSTGRQLSTFRRTLCRYLWVQVGVVEEEQPRHPANRPTDLAAEIYLMAGTSQAQVDVPGSVYTILPTKLITWAAKDMGTVYR